MHRRDGARKIDSRKTKKEKRLERQKVESRNAKPVPAFKACQDGHWEVVRPSEKRPLVENQMAPLDPPPGRAGFDLRAFLADVKSAISRRKLSDPE